MKPLYPLAIVLVLVFTGLSLTGCSSGKLSDEDIEQIATKVAEKVYPRIAADLHKEFALLKGSEEGKKTPVPKPGKIASNKNQDKTNGEKNKEADFLPGPVNPLTATGMAGTNKKQNSPTVVSLNNHPVLNRNQFFEIYKHMTKLYPISALRTAKEEEILKHVVKVELMAAEATVQGLSRNEAFLKSLHRPLTNAVITLLVGDIEQEEKPITDKRIKEQYTKTKAVYRTRPYLSANMIEIDGLEYTPRGKTEKLKSEDLLKKLRANPDSFSSTAKEISLSPTFKLGGKMDRIYPGDLSIEVNSLLEKAEINKILDPVKVRNGHYIIFQVTARHKEAIKPFELVKESIKASLLQKRRIRIMDILKGRAEKAIDSELYLDGLDKDGEPDEILARIEKVTITRDGFKRIVKLQKGMKDQFTTMKEQKALLEGMYQQNLFSTYALKNAEYQRLHNVYLIFFQKEKLATFFLKTKLKDPFDVSNEEITKYYETNLARYKSKTPYVKTRHLMFTGKSESKEDLKAAEKRAIECIEKLAKGSTIKELVTIADGDSGKKEAAPTHWFTGGSTSLGKEYFETVSKIEKGKVVEKPIKVKNSFYVVLLEDKSETTPFDLLKNSIANELSKGKQLEKYRALLEDIEKRQIIKAYPEAISLTKTTKPAKTPKPTDTK